MSAFQFRPRQTEPVFDLLPPDRAARPASRRMHEAPRDVIDAEFVTIVGTRRPVATDDGKHGSRSPSIRRAPDADAFSSCFPLARQTFERAEKLLSRLSNRSFAALVAAAFFLVFMAVGGAGDASTGSASGDIGGTLDLTHVTLTPQDANGMRVLLINAIVENRGPESRDVPAVRADLMADGQLIASTFIDPPVETIEAGESRGISAKLQHAGGKTPQLKLSFAPLDVSSR